MIYRTPRQALAVAEGCGVKATCRSATASPGHNAPTGRDINVPIEMIALLLRRSLIVSDEIDTWRLSGESLPKCASGVSTGLKVAIYTQARHSLKGFYRVQKFVRSPVRMFRVFGPAKMACAKQCSLRGGKICGVCESGSSDGSPERKERWYFLATCFLRRIECRDGGELQK